MAKMKELIFIASDPQIIQTSKWCPKVWHCWSLSFIFE